MLILLLLGGVFAAPPPSDEVGRVRTCKGLAGPAWSVWGESSVNVAERVALRGSLEVPFTLWPVQGAWLVEVAAGPYWLQPYLAAGPTVNLAAAAWPPPWEPGWRVDLGTRVLVRWGSGLMLAASTDGGRVQGRLGTYLEW